MKRCPQWQIDSLRYQNENATHPSAKIRKGWEVRDDTEPLGRRLLTDAEIEEITGERHSPAIMPLPTGIAYRLAQAIIHSRIEAEHHLRAYRIESNPAMFSRAERIIEEDWAAAVLTACENALGCQNRIIAEYQRMLADYVAEQTNPRPYFVNKPPDGLGTE